MRLSPSGHRTGGIVKAIKTVKTVKEAPLVLLFLMIPLISLLVTGIRFRKRDNRRVGALS